MVRIFVIIILTALLCVSSYLLYTNKNITVSIGGTGADREAQTPGGRKEDAALSELRDKDITPSSEPASPPAEAGREDVEVVEADEPEIHLDPTVGMSINLDQQIETSYKVIGPRKFSLLTEKGETIVEIDLDTGNVKINPDYKVDDVTKEFWESVGRKYPEVCFVE
jgi:hypothetical protein